MYANKLNVCGVERKIQHGWRKGGETKQQNMYINIIFQHQKISWVTETPLREESKKRYSEYLFVSFNSFTFFSVKLIHIQLLAFMESTRQRKLSSYLLLPFIFSFAANISNKVPQ